MAIPATGTTWRASGIGAVDRRFNDRGMLAGALIRDNRGAATNISPWKVNPTPGGPPLANWSPFALDGKPRDDLFAYIRQSGEWFSNPEPNESFFQLGAFADDGGPERAPNIEKNDQMILQDTFPFDTTIISEGIEINFTAVEKLKPLLKRLRMNLRLHDLTGNPIVEDPGQENFSIGKPTGGDAPDRQIILMFDRPVSGGHIYTAEGYGLCTLSNLGAFRRSKTDPDVGELGFTVLPDSYLVSKDPNDPLSNELVPMLYVEWTAGDGWSAIGGVPVFAGLAPVAAPGATGVATVVFDEAVGANEPFTYTAEKSVTPFSTWTPAPIGTTSLDTPTAGKVTLSFSGLAAQSTKFRITATGTNGQSALSQLSNAATVI